MTRIEMLRNARQAVQVTFSEYLKIRGKGNPTLVFEGKQCPAFYIQKVMSVIGSNQVSQLIARGKRNVIELRELIRRNMSTANDLVLFFVDSDYDQNLDVVGSADVYVTRGYSIENELCDWPIVERFIRAHFDIADSADETAITDIQIMFEQCLQRYFQASATLNKTVYVCRRFKVKCLPGDDAFTFLDATWSPISVAPKYLSVDQLFDKLSVESGDRPRVLGLLNQEKDFDALIPILQWRGKFIFSFLRRFLIYLATHRTDGSPPFNRPARLSVDPVHPGLLGALSAVCPTPPCLVQFLRKWFGDPEPSPA